MRTFQYSRHSGYEVSEIGDVRYTPTSARLSDGKTIEWHLKNTIIPKHGDRFSDEAYEAYYNLWRRWAERNFYKMRELARIVADYDNTLRDSLTDGQMTHSRVLAQLLNEFAEMQERMKPPKKETHVRRQRVA